MLATSNWWEPGQPGILDIGDVSAMVMLFLAVVGAFIASSRWWFRKLRRIIREEIKEFTEPIQPTANGGLSLPDVSRRVDSMEKTLLDMKESMNETKDLLLKMAVKDATE
jgi:hypothetical protein